MNDRENPRDRLGDESAALRRRLESSETERKRFEQQAARLAEANEKLVAEVAQLKRIEEALQASRQRYRSLVENTSDLVWEVDENNVFTYLSASSRDMLGYAPEELIGKTVFDLMPPEEVERAADTIRTIIESQSSFGRLEATYLHKDGRRVDIEATGKRIADQQGNHLGFRGTSRDVTDRNRAEEALRHSEQQYRQVFESVSDCLLIAGLDGRIVAANRAACRTYGYTHDEITALTVKDLVHPDRHDLFDSFVPLIESEGEFRAESVDVRKDGSTFDVEVRGARFLIDGKPHLLAVVRDISEQKRAEEQIALFHRFAEASGQGLGMADLDSRITYANPTLCRILGEEKPENVVGKTFYSCYCDELKQKLEKEVIPKVLSEGQWIGELELMAGDGSRTPTLEDIFLIRDKTGNPSHFANVITDITQRKQIEERLEVFQRFVEASGQGFGMSDLDGRITYGNSTICRLCGVDRVEHALGKSVMEFHPAEDRRKLEEEVIPAVMKKGQWVGELTLLSSKGHTTPVIVNYFLVRDDDGSPLCLATVITDVSQLKRAQEAIREEQRHLKRSLEASDQERKLIAYEIHDGLTQHLTAAIMYLQSYDQMRRKGDPEASKTYDAGLQMLGQSLSEARSLISGVRPPLLDEAGVVVAVEHLIHQVGDNGGPAIEFHRDVKFERLDPMLENALYRTIQESVANARRHSGSDTIRIEMLQRDDRVRVEIRDRGTGFDPQGVGEGCFGLAGIRERARLLGGLAAVNSAPGKGTRVLVELPLELHDPRRPLE